jgi:hypothetical protein
MKSFNIYQYLTKNIL